MIGHALLLYFVIIIIPYGNSGRLIYQNGIIRALVLIMETFDFVIDGVSVSSVLPTRNH